MDLAARIRAARKHAGMPQRQLAALVGVTRSAVANWEDALRSRPATAHIIALAQQTGVSFEWLATGRGRMLPAVECGGALAFCVLRDAGERRLLQAYRRQPERVRRRILATVEALPYDAETG